MTQFQIGDTVQANDQHGWPGAGEVVAIATPEWIAENTIPGDPVFNSVAGQINVQFGEYPRYEQYWYKEGELQKA